MEEERLNIVNLPEDALKPHPDNPRKEIGDITELTQSIKANGIMQNLTVIPTKDLPGGDPESNKYTILIGHRRFEAGKAAGLKVFPCHITHGMSHAKQVATMLEENIQRNDLTVIEQAKGMQMLLDLGESYQTITEKTGFSESTVRHRVNLLKLNEELLKEKSHQLTITDLAKLESIPEDRRDEALKNAYSSASLTAAVDRISDDIKKERRRQDIISALTNAGLKEDDSIHTWERDVKRFDWEDGTIEKIRQALDYECSDKGFTLGYSADCVYVKIPQEEEIEEEKEESIKHRVMQANRKRTGRIVSIWSAEMKRLYDKLVEFAKENFDKADTNDSIVADLAGKYMQLEQDAYTSGPDMYEIAGEATGDEEPNQKEAFNRLPTSAKLVLGIMSHLGKPYDWDSRYNPQEDIEIIKSVLDRIPFMFLEEAEGILDGSSDLYEEITEETLEQ